MTRVHTSVNAAAAMPSPKNSPAAGNAACTQVRGAVSAPEASHRCSQLSPGNLDSQSSSVSRRRAQPPADTASAIPAARSRFTTAAALARAGSRCRVDPAAPSGSAGGPSPAS
jgi:hypothetical protein